MTIRLNSKKTSNILNGIPMLVNYSNSKQILEFDGLILEVKIYKQF